MTRFVTRVRVRDGLSGFGEWPEKVFSDIWFDFEPPSRWDTFQRGGRGAELVSGTDYDGEWLLETELPATAPIGVYPITYVTVADRAGNYTQLSGPEIAAKGWDASFKNVP
jgi:hypothetical protein